jgi:hypothetical protein
LARILRHPHDLELKRASFMAAVAVGPNAGNAQALIRGSDLNLVSKDNRSRILRDIFGPLPFRPVALPPTCQTPTVVALAQAAYDNRLLPAGTLEPARLAVLADALEEAGCDDADILTHLRQAGVHVRGCWVTDLLLGKA